MNSKKYLYAGFIALFIILFVIYFSASGFNLSNKETKNIGMPAINTNITAEDVNIATEKTYIPITGSIAAKNITTLENGSDLIVLGKVKEILPSRWNTDDGKMHLKKGDSIDFLNYTMYTDIVIQVDKYFKGETDQKTVTVRVEGGEDEYTTITVDYEPNFYKGEKVLLFLMKDDEPRYMHIGPTHYIVSGLTQGKFSLDSNGNIGKMNLTAGSSGMPLDNNNNYTTSEKALKLIKADLKMDN